MATYEFQCSSPQCGAVNELIQPMASPLPDALDCRFCGAQASIRVFAPAVLRGGMGNQPIDIAVGQASAAQWAAIHEQQSARDKARVEARSVGLKGLNPQTYKPLGKGDQALRKQAIESVETHGTRVDASDPMTRMLR